MLSSDLPFDSSSPSAISAESQSTRPLFLEALCAQREFIGEGLWCLPNSLELKPNHAGVRGVFAARDLKAGTIIMKVPLGSTLTPHRAFEEARAILEPLGERRYDLSDDFILACAVYLRYCKADGPSKDALFESIDLHQDYMHSPMVCQGTVELLELLDVNIKRRWLEAEDLDKQISKLGLDPMLFRSCLAFVSSRSWTSRGLIPFMDKLNSAQPGQANCTCDVPDAQTLAHVLLKDVKAGEELCWTYNAANAVSTWWGYGYIDKQRDTVVNVPVTLDEEEFRQFKAHCVAVLNAPAVDFDTRGWVRKTTMIYGLCGPGADIKSPEVIKQKLSSVAMSSFDRVRFNFRIMGLIKRKTLSEQMDSMALSKELGPLGLDFEAEVYELMLQSLKREKARFLSQVKQFNQGQFGRWVNLKPYEDLYLDSIVAWLEAIEMMKRLCQSKRLVECVTELQAFGYEAVNESNCRDLLEQQYVQNPHLKLALVLRHLEERFMD